MLSLPRLRLLEPLLSPTALITVDHTFHCYAMSALRLLLLAALVGATLGSAGHGVHHLTDKDFEEKTADGKASPGILNTRPDQPSGGLERAPEFLGSAL